MANTINLAGIKFHVHPIGTRYKREPGVYAFLRQSGSGWGVLYVGEAESLYDRLTAGLRSHHRYDCAVKRSGATHIAARIVAGDRSVRLGLETALRSHFEPPCNRQ